MIRLTLTLCPPAIAKRGDELTNRFRFVREIATRVFRPNPSQPPRKASFSAWQTARRCVRVAERVADSSSTSWQPVWRHCAKGSIDMRCESEIVVNPIRIVFGHEPLSA